MAWWIRPLQIARRDENVGMVGTGKWRLTAESDEDGGGPYGLCEHEHDTPEEAYQCPEAREEAKKYG